MDSKGYKRILIIKLSSIGDVVHTLPALGALRRGFPEAEIDWLVEEPSSSLLRHHPFIENLYIFNKRTLREAPFTRGIPSLLSLVSALRERSYDLVIDFQGLFKSGILTFLSGGRMRMGFDRTRELSYLFLNRRLPPYDPDLHAVERYMEIPRSLGCPGEVEFHIPVLREDRERIDRLIEGAGDFVLVSPWARWETKLWEVERFVELCDLIRGMGLEVILVGGNEALRSSRRIAEGCRRSVIDLTGRTNLRELAYLASLSRAFVTTDSGPMHVASAAGARVVALFGPTSPVRTGPYGRGHRVVRKDLKCSPCFKRRCEDPECMRSITVEDVMEALSDILEVGIGGYKGLG